MASKCVKETENRWCLTHITPQNSNICSPSSVSCLLVVYYKIIVNLFQPTIIFYRMGPALFWWKITHIQLGVFCCWYFNQDFCWVGFVTLMAFSLRWTFLSVQLYRCMVLMCSWLYLENVVICTKWALARTD